MGACKNGHDAGRYKSGVCKQCSRERNQRPEIKAKLLLLNKARYARKRDEQCAQQREYRETGRGRALRMMQSMAARTKTHGTPVDPVTVEWVQERLAFGVCELSGLTFDMVSRGRKNPFAPSLDRIDSTKGYEKGNCRVILWALNTAFSWWGEEVFRSIAIAWLADCGESHDRDVNAARNILRRAEASVSVSGNKAETYAMGADSLPRQILQAASAPGGPTHEESK